MAAGEVIQMDDLGRTEDDIFDDEDDIFDDDDFVYDDDDAETSFPDTPIGEPSDTPGENIGNLRESLKKDQLAEVKKNLVINFYNSV